MKKEKVKRFGVSLPPSLLKKFDLLTKEIGYKNRSKAIQDAIREYIIKNELKTGRGEYIGIISLIYNHNTRMIADVLINIQHKYYHIMKSNMHLHLDKDNCMELVIVKGDVKKIREIKNSLTAVSGIKCSELIITKVADF